MDTLDHVANSDPSGILLVDKPAGVTSHTVVAMARRALGTRKVGHAGTLDPAATGLLVLGVGPATRLLTFLVGLDKTYEASIALGASTVTDDAEGEIVDTADATRLERSVIEAAARALTGDILQVPSSVSAIKVGGERSYARVRAGESVELAARPVTVRRFELGALRLGDAGAGSEAALTSIDAVIDCTSGTYIRALARDMGTALGVGGHLRALRRTRVGDFAVDDAVAADAIDASALMTPAAAAARALDVIELDADAAALLRSGRRPAIPSGVALDDGALAAAVVEGDLVGIARIDGTTLKVVANLAVPDLPTSKATP